jgi:hypothetical protein
MINCSSHETDTTVKSILSGHCTMENGEVVFKRLKISCVGYE